MSQRGERQKDTTEAYRTGHDRIWGSRTTPIEPPTREHSPGVRAYDDTTDWAVDSRRSPLQGGGTGRYAGYGEPPMGNTD